MAKILEALAYVSFFTLIFFMGYGISKWSEKNALSQPEEITFSDTVTVEIHDTLFIEKMREVIRRDTVLLASVDTLTLHDSILVEIPIEKRIFIGDNYIITAEGFRVKLTDVQISYPIITNTVTQTKLKRWSFGVGAQIGYGYTIHGASPYAGIGVSFGYNF